MNANVLTSFDPNITQPIILVPSLTCSCSTDGGFSLQYHDLLDPTYSDSLTPPSDAPDTTSNPFRFIADTTIWHRLAAAYCLLDSLSTYDSIGQYRSFPVIIVYSLSRKTIRDAYHPMMIFRNFSTMLAGQFLVNISANISFVDTA